MSWQSIRESILLDPGVANLNTGSFGPLPRVVFERVTELRRRLAEEPMDFSCGRRLRSCGRPARGLANSSAPIRAA